MKPWWALEDPTMNGPEDGPEPTSDDLCICETCRDSYEKWIDPEDGRRVTWCCEPCYANNNADPGATA